MVVFFFPKITLPLCILPRTGVLVQNHLLQNTQQVIFDLASLVQKLPFPYDLFLSFFLEIYVIETTKRTVHTEQYTFVVLEVDADATHTSLCCTHVWQILAAWWSTDNMATS